MTAIKLVSLWCRIAHSRRVMTHCRILLILPAMLAICQGERPAFAQSDTLWSESRVLEYDGNECVGQSADTCQSVTSNVVTVADAGPDLITLKCPADFPNLVGWDTEQNEFLRVTVISARPDEKLGVNNLTVSVLNDAVANGEDAAGNAQLYIGCSLNPWNGTPFGAERDGLPSTGILESASQASNP